MFRVVFSPLNFAPTSVSALQQMQNLDFVCMLCLPAPQTVLGHSPEVKQIRINNSAGISSFDFENPDINVISPH